MRWRPGSGIAGYLNTVRHEAEADPLPHLGNRPLPQVRVRVRVRAEPFRPGKLEERRQEQARRAGDDDGRAYAHRHGLDGDEATGLPSAVVLDWDATLRTTLHRAVIVGDPGMGKSWLLRYEAIRLADAAFAELAGHGDPSRLTLPIRLPLAELSKTLADERNSVRGDPPRGRGPARRQRTGRRCRCCGRRSRTSRAAAARRLGRSRTARASCWRP